MKKKVLALVLILTMALTVGLVACSDGSGSSGNGEDYFQAVFEYGSGLTLISYSFGSNGKVSRLIESYSLRLSKLTNGIYTRSGSLDNANARIVCTFDDGETETLGFYGDYIISPSSRTYLSLPSTTKLTR
jgi:hypothetical protein